MLPLSWLHFVLQFLLCTRRRSELVLLLEGLTVNLFCLFYVRRLHCSSKCLQKLVLSLQPLQIMQRPWQPHTRHNSPHNNSSSSNSSRMGWPMQEGPQESNRAS